MTPKHNFKDLVGLQFDDLTVLRRVGSNSTGHATWLCRHVNSKEVIRTGAYLTGGKLRAKSPEFSAWYSMIRRCTVPGSTAYEEYGGRGIRVCLTWLASFDTFLHDMGLRPSLGHSLDRTNVNGDYSVSNCKWVSRTTQNRNTRRTKRLTHNGESLCLEEWSEKLGIKSETIRSRLRRGDSIAKVLSPH